MQRIRWTSVMVIAGATLLPLAASAQIGAKTSSAPSPDAAAATAAQLAKLQVALQKLTVRVTELEEQRSLDVVDDDAVAEAKRVKMQDDITRLAKLLDATRSALTVAEKSLAGVKAAQAKQALGDETADGSSVVRAPFLVVDGAGKPLFRVDNGAAGAGRAVLGNPNGSRITLDAEVSNGSAIALGNGATNLVTIFGSSAYSAVTAISGTARAWVATRPKDGGYIGLTNDQGQELAQMSVRKGRGYFELNDGTGSKMVEAGSLESGKGYVLVQPSRVNINPAGNPSVLIGGKKP